MDRFDPCGTDECKKRCDSYGVACDDIMADEIERLRAELELHKGALIAEQEHVETLEAELAAWRSALAKVGPYYIPATSVSDEEAEEVYAAIDAARKGKGE